LIPLRKIHNKFCIFLDGKTENQMMESGENRGRHSKVPHAKSVCGNDPYLVLQMLVDCVWNVMAHAQKPDFVFRRNGRVHLNRRGRKFSQLLAAEVCASAVVMLDTPCSVVVWRVLATHSIRQFPLHFPSRASRCAITFQLDSKILSVRNMQSWCG
jgi:hypothetical protein